MLADDIRHARANLHSAQAALVTATQRLSDAELRFADEMGVSQDFATLIAPSEAIGWWRQQVDVCERSVTDRRADLARAIASQGSVSCQN
jgi:outer membrane protein TolC